MRVFRWNQRFQHSSRILRSFARSATSWLRRPQDDKAIFTDIRAAGLVVSGQRQIKKFTLATDH